MSGLIVVFEYGRTADRSALKGLGLVDEVQCYKGQEQWHIKPLYWTQGSPLPKWVDAGSVAVLNAEAPAFASAS
jgi:hypothetical protein